MDDFDLYRLFKTLHVLAVIVLGGGAIMEGLIGPILAKSRSVQELRAYALLIYISENYLSIAAAVFIVIFGYATADRIGYDLGTTWLLLGQILFYIIVAIALTVLRPAASRLYGLVKDAPDGPVPQEIVEELQKPLPAIAGAATGILFVIIVYLMVAKPDW